MQFEDAVAISDALADAMEESEAPRAFGAAPDPAHEAPHVGVGVSFGERGAAKVAVRGWTRDDIKHFMQVFVARNGVPPSELDVVVTGRIHASPPTALPAVSSRLTGKRRPVHPGVSIGHVGVTAGTLGALVLDGNGNLQMLSNNHVLANSSGHPNRTGAKVGDLILQQGPVDGGQPPPVGTLHTWTALKARGNLVDAALGACDPLVGWDPEIPQIGFVKGMSAPADMLEVRKVGRSTDLTSGTIATVRVRSLPVMYGNVMCRFDDVMEITGVNGPFSRPGDSGSLVVDRSRAAVGLLFAGTLDSTFANPIAHVQSALGFRSIKGA